MNKLYKGHAGRIAVALILCLVLTTGLSAGAAFNPTLKITKAVNNGRPDNCRPVTNQGYLNCQGIAFDVYTKKDGYAFNQGTDGNKGFQLVHFNMTADGKITKKESLKYAVKNVGHANDAAIYMNGKGQKYMFVAISGGSEKKSVTSAGYDTKVAVIWMDEYSKKKVLVRGCSIKVKKGVTLSKKLADCAFSGVAYAGLRNVAGKKRATFVLKDGRTFYAAYLGLSAKRAATLTIFDSARVEKPMISYKGKKYEAATQGVTYHNGYLYLSYSGEKAKVTNQNMLITRIKYADLFKGTYSTVKKMQVNAKRYETATVSDYSGAQVKVNLAKHIPEGIFFRTLNGTENLYISINRGSTSSVASDIDCILRSTQKY